MVYTESALTRLSLWPDVCWAEYTRVAVCCRRLCKTCPGVTTCVTARRAVTYICSQRPSPLGWPSAPLGSRRTTDIVQTEFIRNGCFCTLRALVRYNAIAMG